MKFLSTVLLLATTVSAIKVPSTISTIANNTNLISATNRIKPSDEMPKRPTQAECKKFGGLVTCCKIFWDPDNGLQCHTGYDHVKEYQKCELVTDSYMFGPMCCDNDVDPEDNLANEHEFNWCRKINTLRPGIYGPFEGPDDFVVGDVAGKAGSGPKPIQIWEGETDGSASMTDHVYKTASARESVVHTTIANRTLASEPFVHSAIANRRLASELVPTAFVTLVRANRNTTYTVSIV